MVKYRVVCNGEMHDCRVIITGGAPETALLSYGDCTSEIQKKEPLVEGFEIGQIINIKFMDADLIDNAKLHNEAPVSRGGATMASMSFGMNKMDYDAYLLHFKVNDVFQQSGIGELMFLTFIAHCELGNADTISMTIGGGEDTKKFLTAVGIPEEDIEFTGRNLTKTKTHLKDIDYNKDRVEVNRQYE